jgi:hypothetical protein
MSAPTKDRVVMVITSALGMVRAAMSEGHLVWTDGVLLSKTLTAAMKQCDDSEWMERERPKRDVIQRTLEAP